MDGMDFLIKRALLFSLLFLQGCNSFNSIAQKQIDLIKDPYYFTLNNIPKSKVPRHIVSINNGDERIITPSNTYNKNDITWRFSEDITYKITNGKIIKTNGLDNDIDIKKYKDFNINDLQNLDEVRTSALIKFSNPETTYLQINYSYKLMKKGIINDRLGYATKLTLIEESFNIPLIKWSGKNYFWINDKNIIIKTKQLVEPLGTKIRIDILN